MSDVPDAVVIVAAAAAALAHRFRPGKVIQEVRPWWILPAVLIPVSARAPGFLDPGRPARSVALLAAGALLGAAAGAVWARTTHLWADSSGAFRARGGRATAAAWAAGTAAGAALYGLAVLGGVRYAGQTMMLVLALALLIRAGAVALRARTAKAPATA
ncbi:DUF1453 domain-containing protein [Streptomyces sp. GC420]|uniref:DUF1453 domain-containing protein n=1 Tax=Streptomyces sp. GC420 TaxID=2697568 RepID=UPI001414EDE6|nr:DUF1453 domain-containing protein [Streptomyces sp. GC420]NBM14160.1 DUF1453 domain-containing protein [Streptomyces sp. GC420]